MRTRVLLVALAAVAGCADWKSLYRTDPEDAAALDGGGGEGMDTSPADHLPGDEPDVLAPVDADVDPADAPIIECSGSEGPLVLWRFNGSGVPSPSNFISDTACRPPSVPLGWDLPRRSGATKMGGGWLFLDGAFLESQIKDSDDLGRALVKAGGLSIELWFKAMATETGTIFATRGAMSGRAFGFEQREGVVRFTLHTTATDSNGDKLIAPLAPTPGAAAELTGRFTPAADTPVHVVATFSSDTRVARLFINGVLVQTVVHAKADQPAPVLVWASGKNELGLGGTFEGDAWRGWVYLAAVYDRALSDAQIGELFGMGPQRPVVTDGGTTP